MFTDWNRRFNTHCELHGEEVTSKPSFGYNSQMNLWTCWGKCQDVGHGSGRVVFYHYIYRKKFDPNFTLTSALKELHKIFTSAPVDKNNRFVQAYKDLPYPKLQKSSVHLGSLDEAALQIAKPIDTTINIDTVELFTESNTTLSGRFMANFLTKKDKTNVYRKENIRDQMEDNSMWTFISAILARVIAGVYGTLVVTGVLGRICPVLYSKLEFKAYFLYASEGQKISEIHNKGNDLLIRIKNLKGMYTCPELNGTESAAGVKEDLVRQAKTKFNMSQIDQICIINDSTHECVYRDNLTGGQSHAI